MNLLGATLYDPAAAVSKATSSLLAMTALDTTNLRLTVTVPAHGKLRFHMRGIVTGATTVPTLLLGVMNSTTVIGRVSPTYENATANASSQNFAFDADFTASGLTPGSTAFDAAYAVQVVVASTNIKYGGPNNNSGANAWGGFLFEIWDPQPLQTNGQLVIDANGRVDVSKISGTAQTGLDIGGNYTAARATKIDNLDAAVTTRMATYTQPTGFLAATFPASIASTTNITAGTITTATNLTNLPTIPANWLTAAGIAASALNGKGDWNIGKTGYALSSAGVQAIWDALTSALTTVGSIGKLLVDNINATITSRMASYTQPTGFLAATFPTTVASTTNITAASGVTVATNNDKTGYTVSTVSDKTGYSLSSAGIQAIWDALTSALTTVGSIGKLLVTNIDAAISSRSSYAGGDTSGTTTLLSRLTSGRATSLDNLDATVSSRLASASYTAPDNTSVTAIKAKTDNLPATPAATGDAMTLTTGERTSIATAVWASTTRTLSSFGTLAADVATAVWGAVTRTLTAFSFTVDTNANATETAIKAKTDSLTFTKAGEVDANTQSVNGVTVTGTGAPGDEWGA